MRRRRRNSTGYRKQPLVAEYLRLERPRESALTFVRQARELQKISGMLRLHYNSYALIADVISAFERRPSKAGSTVLEFADLLTEPNAEAVVYVPMLGMGNAEEVVLRIPVSEFSPEGFQGGVRQHRSAMEGRLSAAPRGGSPMPRSLLPAQSAMRPTAGRWTRRSSLGSFPV